MAIPPHEKCQSSIENGGDKGTAFENVPPRNPLPPRVVLIPAAGFFNVRHNRSLHWAVRYHKGNGPRTVSSAKAPQSIVALESGGIETPSEVRPNPKHEPGIEVLKNVLFHHRR